MIIDFHTHVFPPFFRDRRSELFSQEPGFESLYGEPNAKLSGVQELLKSMEAEGVERSVILGFPWKEAEYYRRHNDYIIEAVLRHPDRLSGFGCFSPLSPGSPQETERCLGAGLCGVGELAVYGSGLSTEIREGLSRVMAVCLHYNVPLMIHTNEPVGHTYAGKTPMTLQEIYRFLKAYPSNRIVLAHWGGGILFYSLMKKEMKACFQNVWFDTAASPYLYTPDIYRIAVELLGPDKILFGSDYPLLRPQRYLEEMAAADLSPEVISKIAGRNAAELLEKGSQIGP